MNKRWLVLIGAAVLLGAGLIVSNNKSSITTESITLFYSKTCPHCKEVEEYINKNKIREKIKFIEKEINGSEENKAEIIKAAQNCKFTGEVLPLPFLYIGNKCYMGPTEVTSFFKERIK